MSDLSPGRAATLLWADLRLVVLDIETLMELPGLGEAARVEMEAAIASVRQTGKRVRLAPQGRAARRRQHQAAQTAGLLSESTGAEPDRAVSLRRPLGPPLERPEPPAARVRAEHRAINVALVSCRRGKPEDGAWHSLINPGAPVDPHTSETHHLTDEMLAVAPTFVAVAPEILHRLTPQPGETLVLVAHNASFDIGVLRGEFARLGVVLPDLPVLDTGGTLAARVGVSPAGGGLDDLAAALGIRIAGRHTALGDARATAEAACDLLRLAAARGIGDIAEVLAEGGARTVASIAASAPGPSRRPAHSTVVIAPEHRAAHWPLAAAATRKETDRWTTLADACATLRCPDLGDTTASLVGTAHAAPAVVVDALLEVLRRRASAGDGPGAATAVGGLCALLERWCPWPPAWDFTGRYPLARKPAIALFHRVEGLVAGLPRCGADACPACRDGRLCPRDAFLRVVARAVLDATWEKGRLTRGSTLMAWLRPDGNGGWRYHRQAPDAPMSHSRRAAGGTPAGPLLADAVIALMLAAYPMLGEEPDRQARARDLLPRVIADDCRDPGIWETWARIHATGGRQEVLEAAIALCDHALGWEPKQTTDPAWASLALTREQFAGRLSRVRERRVIKDGQSVPLRRRRPADPRTRPMRFVRG